MPPRPESIRKIALVNFGGIGDEILFSPVIEEIRRHLPQAQLTLFLEDRSQVAQDLLPGLDAVRPLPIQGQSRLKTFMALLRHLRAGGFDAVLSSGSSPFIPILLFLSGIRVRVGFETGAPSRLLLTVAAPLGPNRQGYAGRMYFSLANGFLRWLLGAAYQPMDPVLPHLKAPPLEDLLWAKSILKAEDPQPKVLIHPGVSTISVRKNILKGWAPGHWADLIRRLTKQGYRVYLVGGPDDRETVEDIRRLLPSAQSNFVDLYGQTRHLRQLAALIQACDLLVCVDSSPMHLAVGYGRPLVAMFGPTDEKKLLPADDPRFQAVTVDNLPCRPCLWDIRSASCNKPVCLDVSVSAMVASVEQLLRANTPFR